MRPIIVAPSILSADFDHIESEVLKVEPAGAKFIHLDVMDGVFVPAKTFGPELVRRISPFAGKMVRDTHLMVADPKSMIDEFAAAGSELITFHYESYDNDEDRFSCLHAIHDAGLLCGMSIKPDTPEEVLLPFLPELDLVLVMSVEPGKGGQKFMEKSLQKLSYFRKHIDELGKKIYLEVDGGINDETAKIAVRFGADVLVAGSYIYGHEDYARRIQELLR